MKSTRASAGRHVNSQSRRHFLHFVTLTQVITPRFFQGIGAIAFAYVCQHSSFLVFASLSNPTPARWSKVEQSAHEIFSRAATQPFMQVTHFSVGFAAAVCVVIGVAGFLPFANGVCPDVLNSFPRDDPVTSGASPPYNSTAFCLLLLSLLQARDSCLPLPCS